MQTPYSVVDSIPRQFFRVLLLSLLVNFNDTNVYETEEDEEELKKKARKTKINSLCATKLKSL